MDMNTVILEDLARVFLIFYYCFFIYKSVDKLICLAMLSLDSGG